ncbi:hypothetical protein CP09DC77_0045B, partial [Chlamydia psittaci 09DC77]
QNLLRRSSKIF